MNEEKVNMLLDIATIGLANIDTVLDKSSNFRDNCEYYENYLLSYANIKSELNSLRDNVLSDKERVSLLKSHHIDLKKIENVLVELTENENIEESEEDSL